MPWNHPLTPAGAQLKAGILAIPCTHEPMLDTLPGGVTPDRMEELFYAAKDGANWVVPELRRMIDAHPEYPGFMNFLRTAYLVREQFRQADRVLDDLATRHPDYLFTRIGLAGRVFENNLPPAQALEFLGEDLDLRRLYPDRTMFHESEIRHYHYHVGIYHARTGHPDLTAGVAAALDVLIPDCDAIPHLEREIMMANLERMKRTTTRDRRIRIEVEVPPLPASATAAGLPAFHHPELLALYQYGFDVPAGTLRQLLSLPRATLVPDLVRVLDNAAARTPDFIDGRTADDATTAPLHALHLLAEIGATEALGAVLRWFSQHPDGLQFWLGDIDCQGQLARLCNGSVPQAAEWLKTPGIGTFGKALVTSALAALALTEPGQREAVVAGFNEVLSFMLASPPEDNVVDTRFISLLVSDATELKAPELLPVITRLWEQDLIEEFYCGDLAKITELFQEPPGPPPAKQSIYQAYEEYISYDEDDEEDDDFEDDDDDDDPYDAGEDDGPGWLGAGMAGGGSKLYMLDPPAPEVGRNDPCPCGSGRKYKKCCMK